MTQGSLLDWNAGAAAKAAGSRPSPAATFDRDRGLRERDRGIAKVTLSNADFVARMRVEAERIARAKGEVHVDDVRRRAMELGIEPTSSAAWGPIFSERRKWRIVGYRASTWAANHAHRSPVRVLAEAG